MTNCYVCGHPLLKGQRADRISGQIELRNIEIVAHLNPADHLPTLNTPQNNQQIHLLQNARQIERRRAAKMAEEADAAAHDACTDNCVGCMVTGSLAQRIRYGD